LQTTIGGNDMLGWFKKKEHITEIEIISPVAGAIVPLEQVPDEAFASKAMGEGFAIEPSEGKVLAPFSGKVAHIMEKSKHAILLEHSTGVQVLIHVGINTVGLKGDGFQLHVKVGDHVRQGQLLLSFDIDKIQKAGYPVITPLIIPDGQDQVEHISINIENNTPILTPLAIVHLKS
jgi:PTS system glucose-specific IIA component